MMKENERIFIMELVLEYLMKRNKIEIVMLVLIFVFSPIYLVEFLYYPEWYEYINFIKASTINVSILAVAYVIQVIVFCITHMLFTKTGRTTEDIITYPLIVLGASVYMIIIGRMITNKIIAVIVGSLVFSFFLEIIFSVSYELIEKRNKVNK